MSRRELNFYLDWLLVIASVVTMSTGLILLFFLHVGSGVHAASALGVGKLAWLNVHRLSAVVVLAGSAAHVVLHWRAFSRRLARVFRKNKKTKKRRNAIELLMYATFLVTGIASLVAWWLLEGSSPLLGPAIIGPLTEPRHAWIDAHNFSSLALLALLAHHVGHRWRFLAGRRRGARHADGAIRPYRNGATMG